MFKIDNEKIGRHLADLIKSSKYKSDRQFGIAYLKLRDDTEDIDSDDIQKIQNRICQIKKGNKGIQIEDLPILAELLHVSIDEILSAGTSLAPVSSRVSNYSIAFSKDPAEWDAYIKRDDKLILNTDEYNKTVIDYALESGNYQFLKYLMNNDYIWFVGNDKNEYHLGFGAGCSIKRRTISFTDTLDVELKSQDNLRFKMISLAITNDDFDILNRLHAREIPLLYTINHVFHHTLRDKHLPESKNMELMIDSIASSNYTILSYFFEEFEIESARSPVKNTFIFPYVGALLDIMIRHRSKNACIFLEKAIAYNKKVQRRLQQYVDESIKSCEEFLAYSKNHDFYNDDYYKHEAWRDYYVYPETGFIAFKAPTFIKRTPSRGFITNIIHVTANSTDTEAQFLIYELNETYNTFIMQYEEKEA